MDLRVSDGGIRIDLLQAIWRQGKGSGHLRDGGRLPVRSSPLQQSLLPLYWLQNQVLLSFIHHARAVQLEYKVLLLAKNGHGCTICLNGMESGRRLDFPVHNERPNLLALLLCLHSVGHSPG